ncbi:MAG: hypothetical protein Q4G30_02235 [Actinomycetaceae bacterium]|nr:hypothetical protein [Actinomycetaceae bacterium]
MDVSGVGAGMDLATMKMIMNGANAVKQVSAADNAMQTVGTNVITIAMASKAVEAGRLDTYA